MIAKDEDSRSGIDSKDAEPKAQEENINPLTGKEYPEGWHHEGENMKEGKAKKRHKKVDSDDSNDSDSGSDDSSDDSSDVDSQSDTKTIATDDFITKETKSTEPWKATEQQLFERSQIEAKMTRQELASYAVEWVQYLDPLTENEYYVNKHTNELSHVVPGTNLHTRWIFSVT